MSHTRGDKTTQGYDPFRYHIGVSESCFLPLRKDLSFRRKVVLIQGRATLFKAGDVTRPC